MAPDRVGICSMKCPSRAQIASSNNHFRRKIDKITNFLQNIKVRDLNATKLKLESQVIHQAKKDWAPHEKKKKKTSHLFQNEIRSSGNC